MTTRAEMQAREAWEDQAALAVTEIEDGEQAARYGADTLAVYDRCCEDGKLTRQERRYIRERLRVANALSERNLAHDRRDIEHVHGQLSLLAAKKEPRGNVAPVRLPKQQTQLNRITEKM